MNRWRHMTLASLLAIPSFGSALEFGLNVRPTPDTVEPIAALMQQRNFRSARIDLFWDQDVGTLRRQASLIRAHGGRVQVVLQTSHQWDHRCRTDLAAVEQEAYRQAAIAVHGVKDLVHEFELLNEPQLREEIVREVPWNSAGTSAAPYRSRPCMASLAGALRGMSRAVADVRAASGLPLRIILGVIGRDFGYLRFLQEQGVHWDVTGYHVYPRLTSGSMLSDPWYGPGGLLTQLASFGKPIHLNEFNCGETYDAGFDNQPGSPSMEACLRSLAVHLKGLRYPTAARLESVHFYELFDEPHKPAPEDRFGLLRASGAPKVQLFLATAFSGGALTAAERLEITSRGLLTDAEVDAMRVTPGVPVLAPPARR